MGDLIEPTPRFSPRVETADISLLRRPVSRSQLPACRLANCPKAVAAGVSHRRPTPRRLFAGGSYVTDRHVRAVWATRATPQRPTPPLGNATTARSTERPARSNSTSAVTVGRISLGLTRTALVARTVYSRSSYRGPRRGPAVADR